MPPGALANLAIDLGDPGRMAKARRLYRSSAVSALDIEGGTAFASVADTDGTFEVEVTVVQPLSPDQIPQPSDLELTCTCDDAADVCRHGLATVLALAEEVEIDVRTLGRWVAFQLKDENETADVPVADHDHDFFVGAWRGTPAEPHLSRLRPTEGSLVVDDVDAGPVVTDATRAIVHALNR